MKEEGAVARVAEWVVAAVTDGRLAGGQRLVELDLVRTLGVGRNAVREAVQRLAADGILDVERHRGPVVRRLSRADLDELFDIRERLEGLAARNAAARRQPEAGALRDFNIAMLGAAEEGDTPRFVALNTQFHGWLLDASTGPWLRPLSVRLHLPLMRMQFQATLTRAAMRDSAVQHDAIVAAVASGRPALAERAMRRHLRQSRENLRALPDALFG